MVSVLHYLSFIDIVSGGGGGALADQQTGEQRTHRALSTLDVINSIHSIFSPPKVSAVFQKSDRAFSVADPLKSSAVFATLDSLL